MNADNFVAQYLRNTPAEGLILDLACGNGRHSRLALEQGYSVVAVDRTLPEDFPASESLTLLEYDLEQGNWPFPPEFFDGIVVANYLHRPLFPFLRDSLKPDGVLIYTTFMQGNEQFGRPRDPDFLLQPGELQQEFPSGFEHLAFAEGPVGTPPSAVRQSLCVRKLTPQGR